MTETFTVEGARIYARIPTGIPFLGDITITETLVVSWIVMAVITLQCIILTRNMTVTNISKRQAAAEYLVGLANNFVRNNMGDDPKWKPMVPFVAALFSTSIVSNIICLTGLRSPTADLSVEAAWALLVFVIITGTKIRTGGLIGFLKGYTTPIFLMTPFNILSDIATPISMACRHFGNILSGIVIDGLIYWALSLASAAILGLLPGVLGDVLSGIPILQVGIPAIAGLYFDWFTGFMQAFIFCMLTTLYIANAAES